MGCPSEVPKANCPGGSMAAPEGEYLRNVLRRHTSSCRENVLGPGPDGEETVDVLMRQVSPVLAEAPSSKVATTSSGRRQRCPVRDMVVPEPAVTPSRSSSRSSGRANKPARFSDAADD
ncbi:unnamed protein product, partial [Pylaiella littoralis]